MADHYHHALPFGAAIDGPGRLRFRLWAPDAPNVQLEIDGHTPVAMMPDGDGFVAATAPGGVGTRYAFRLPDGPAMPDPASRRQADDANGPSEIIDPLAYAWRHGGWRGRPWHEAVILEVHVGLCGGFVGVMDRLQGWRDLGITAIELMPIADFPGGRNWGYDGVLPFAPDAAYGTPDALKALVDAAHGLGLMVLLDVVYNHFGPDGNYLHAYASRFFRDDIQTPWGAAIDFRRQEVREFFIQNALMWIEEYRFDGLRFDAVHQISEPDFLDDMARTIRAATGPSRHVHLVLENERNGARHLAPGLFDAQWADDFHHCLHVLLTDEREGYYEDFTDRARLLARCLSEGFAYQGEVSPRYGKKRGEPSAHLPTTAFIICLQNHDQIGNRAFGDRLTTLAEPAALDAARALLLLCPFMPLLFMGDEWGTRTPFLYFTDHQDELADLVRDGRRREFQCFAAFADPERRALIPDPNAPATFAASTPDPAEAALPEHARILEQHRALLALRARFITPRIPGARSAGATVLSPRAVRASWRMGDGALLTIAINLGDKPVLIGQVRGALLYGTEERQALTIGEGALDPRSTAVFLAERDTA
jgi:malto-oligosyltrehalose trehalohydrolase